MFFGIGLPELFVLALLGLIVFGPERLPEFAAKAARAVRSLRAMAAKAMADLNVESAAVSKTLADLQSITPRAIVSDVVSTVVAGGASATVRPAAGAPSTAQTPNVLRPDFDPDAT
jgi:sec-independent protein translocase protein TatB